MRTRERTTKMSDPTDEFILRHVDAFESIRLFGATSAPRRWVSIREESDCRLFLLEG